MIQIWDATTFNIIPHRMHQIRNVSKDHLLHYGLVGLATTLTRGISSTMIG
jgi:hypothetical protein